MLDIRHHTKSGGAQTKCKSQGLLTRLALNDFMQLQIFFVGVFTNVAKLYRIAELYIFMYAMSAKE